MGYIEDLRAMIGHTCVNLCGSVVILQNEQGQILMQQRTYPYGKWGLPGGLMELGESAEDTARREVYEETGLKVGDLALLGVYSGKGYLCKAQNGDEWYVISVAYVSTDYTGTLSVHDDESISLEWRDPRDLPENIAGTQATIIRDYLKTLA